MAELFKLTPNRWDRAKMISLTAISPLQWFEAKFPDPFISLLLSDLKQNSLIHLSLLRAWYQASTKQSRLPWPCLLLMVPSTHLVHKLHKKMKLTIGAQTKGWLTSTEFHYSIISSLFWQSVFDIARYHAHWVFVSYDHLNGSLIYADNDTWIL